MKSNQHFSAAMAFLSLTLSGNVLADDSYQYEATIEQQQVDIGNDNVNQTTAFLRYYLAPVPTGKGPLAEAAFSERSASVFAAYQYNRFRVPGGHGSHSRSLLGGVYADKNSDLYLRGSLIQINNDSGKIYQASAGWFFDDNWLVSIDMAHQDHSSHDLTHWGLSSKRLFTLSSGDSINVVARYQRFDDDWSDMAAGQIKNTYTLGGDYYFGKHFSLGAEYGWGSPSLAIEDSHYSELRAKWYFNDTMAVNAAVTFASRAEGPGVLTENNFDQASIGLTMRF